MTQELDLATGWVKKHEGWRDKPYRCTAGKLTIGFGRNLDDVGISQAEGEAMLRNDLERAGSDAVLFAGLPAWELMSPARRAVLIDMALNLGFTRLSKFKATQAAIRAGDFSRAADQMLASLWAKQVGQRARFLAEVMRTGEAA